MLFGEVFDNRNSQPADDVRQALGRLPPSFADYASRTARPMAADAARPAPEGMNAAHQVFFAATVGNGHPPASWD